MESLGRVAHYESDSYESEQFSQHSRRPVMDRTGFPRQFSGREQSVNPSEVVPDGSFGHNPYRQRPASLRRLQLIDKPVGAQIDRTLPDSFAHLAPLVPEQRSGERRGYDIP